MHWPQLLLSKADYERCKSAVGLAAALTLRSNGEAACTAHSCRPFGATVKRTAPQQQLCRGDGDNVRTQKIGSKLLFNIASIRRVFVQATCDRRHSLLLVSRRTRTRARAYYSHCALQQYRNTEKEWETA